MNSSQRGRIEDAVGVLFVDDPHNDHVVEVEVQLDLVVEDPGALVRRQHVLGIGIDINPRDLAAQGHCQHQHG